MVVQSDRVLSDGYIADGNTRRWPFFFPVIDPSHLRVLIVRDGVEQEAVGSLSFENAVFPLTEGAVIFPAVGLAAIAAGATVYVERRVPLAQLTRYGNQGGFFPEKHETSFDLAMMAIQQTAARVRGSLRTLATDGPLAALPAKLKRAGKVLGFDEIGNPVAVELLKNDGSFQQVSEKNKSGGYAGLDEDGLIYDFLLPSSIYVKEEYRNVPGGFAGLGPDGKVSVDNLPPISGGSGEASPRQFFYVGDFGIPQDDPTGDHGPAMANVLAALIAAGGGHVIIDRPVHVPKGWLVRGASNFTVECVGKGYIQVEPGAFHAAIRPFECTNVVLRNLDVRHGGNPTRAQAAMAIDCYKCKFVRVENCRTKGCLAGIWSGLTDYMVVTGCHVIDPIADGIHFALASRYCIAIGNTTANCGDDHFACTSDMNIAGQYPGYPTSHITFANNIARDGFWGAGVINYESNNVLIIGNQIQNVAGSGISISPLEETEHLAYRPLNCSIIGNRISRPGQARYVLGDSTQGEAYVSYGNGIYIGDIVGCLVADNHITEVTGANQSQDKAGVFLFNCDDVTIRGNRIRTVNGHGVTGEGTLTDITVADNHIDAVQRSGIDLRTRNPSLQGYTDVARNRTRRVNLSGGSGFMPIRIGTTGNGGAVIVDTNTDLDGKTSELLFNSTRSVIPKDNFPPIWYPFAPDFRFDPANGNADSAVSKSGETGRFCYEGGHVVVNATVTLGQSFSSGTLAMTTPGPVATGERVALLSMFCAGDNTYFMGRYRAAKGGYNFWANTGAQTAQGTRKSGEYRVEGRIPMN